MGGRGVNSWAILCLVGHYLKASLGRVILRNGYGAYVGHFALLYVRLTVLGVVSLDGAIDPLNSTHQRLVFGSLGLIVLLLRLSLRLLRLIGGGGLGASGGILSRVRRRLRLRPRYDFVPLNR